MNFSGRPDEVWILTSPKAGRGDRLGVVGRLAKLLSDQGIQVVQTDCLHKLAARAEQSAAESVGPLGDDVSLAGRWLVVTAGGDGTLAIAASRLGKAVPLVPMPMGTENLLARHYGFSADAAKVVDTIINGEDRRIDAGRATKLDAHGNSIGRTRLFLVMATAGFDAEVVRQVHLRRRGHLSRWTYAKPILRTILGYRFPFISTRVTTTSSTTDALLKESAWTMAFNLPCYAASLPVAPATVDDDGQLDVLNLRRGSVWMGMVYFVSILGRRLVRRSDVQVSRATSLTWRSASRVPFQLDGDYAGHLPVRLETVPGRVCLRMPVSR